MATKATGKKGAGTRKRRERKNIERGAAHIQSTFNNTIVTITDTQGNAVSAAVCAANGVDLREPLKPISPALAQETALP